jgi:hypothetical protein
MEIVQWNNYRGQERGRLSEILHGYQQRAVGMTALQLCETAELFHGTPVSPELMGEFIVPAQAITGKSDGTKVNHGSEATVSASTTLNFPIIRSLLHNKRNEFRGNFYPLLARVANAANEPYIFTSATALDILVKQGLKGFVYGNGQLPDTAECFTERIDLAEYRDPEKIRWDWAATTTHRDLPGNLHVIGAKNDDAREFVKRFEMSEAEPLDLAHTLGICVTALGEK